MIDRQTELRYDGNFGRRYGLGPSDISIIRDLFSEPVARDTVFQAEIYLRDVVADKRSLRDEPTMLQDPETEAFLTQERDEFGGRSILAAIRYAIEEEKRWGKFIPADKVPNPALTKSQPDHINTITIINPQVEEIAFVEDEALEQTPELVKMVAEEINPLSVLVVAAVSDSEIPLEITEQPIKKVTVSQGSSNGTRKVFIPPTVFLDRLSAQPAVLPEERPVHPSLSAALSDVNFTFIDPRSREFLKQAFVEGSHLATPSGMNSQRWIIYRNIFGTFISSHVVLEVVGQIFGVSRERIRQINAAVLEKIWLNSPDTIKEQFPLDSLTLTKLVDSTAREWLLVKDNLGSEVVELLEQGLSGDEIRSRYGEGVVRSHATDMLKMLREMNFAVGRLMDVIGEGARIQQEFRKENLSDGEIQNLLDQIDRSLYHRLRKSGEITPITPLLISMGFHFKSDRHIQIFYDALIEAGIPLGKAESIVRSGLQQGQRFYHFIASLHKQRAEQALKSKPDLAKFL